jgi:hypothetical protein
MCNLQRRLGRHYFEESNNVGGATNWSLLDKNGNQVILELAVLLISLCTKWKRQKLGVLTKFGSDYQLVARSEKMW